MPKPCVVLLHASLSTGRQWRPVERALSTEFRVLAPDLMQPGPPPGGDAVPYSVALEADAVVARIDGRYGAGTPFHLVGHGFGAVVALEVARRHAPRVQRVALYEPTCFNRLADPADREFVQRVARAVELLVARGLPEGAARMYHDFWHGPGAFDALDAPARNALADGAAKLVLELRATAPDSGCVRDCAGIEAPVRLLGGARSFVITRRVLEGLAAVLKAASIGWIDADHTGPVTEPARFLAALNAFLAPPATGRP